MGLQMFEAGSQLPINCFTVEMRVEFQVWSVRDCRCCRKDHNYPMDLYCLTVNRVPWQRVCDCKCSRQDYRYLIDLFCLTVKIEFQVWEYGTADVPGRITITP